MKADPQRQWFAYHNEKEMGPFSETELHSKLKSGELDNNAYVFTEGMTDWALVSDMPVLAPKPEASKPEPAKFEAPKPAQNWADQGSMAGGTASGTMNAKTRVAEVQPTATQKAAAKSAAFSGSQHSQISQISRVSEPVKMDPAKQKAAAAARATTHTPQAGDTGKGFGRAENSKVSQVSKATVVAAGLSSQGVMREPISSPAASRGAEPPSFERLGSTQQENAFGGLAPDGEDLPHPQPRGAAEPTAQGPAPGKAGKAAKAPRQPLKLSLPKFSLRARVLLLVIVFGVLGAMAVQNGLIPGFDGATSVSDTADTEDGSATNNENSEAGSDSSQSAASTQNTATNTGSQVGGARAGSAQELDWTELRRMRESKDTQGPPYRLASRTLGDRHPIVVGVLSSLIKADELWIAVFPYNDRNLMAVPRVWFAKIPVIDGYFSIGPLNLDGDELPSGSYHVYVQSGANFLGDTSFEVGTWPTGAKLTEAQSQIQANRQQLAEKERTALEVKLREVNSALDQLKTHGRFASQGPKGARDWRRVSKPWLENLNRAKEEQVSVMSGPMFYPESQANLYAFLEEMNSLYDALEIFSKGGQRLLLKSRKKGLGQLWAEISQKQSTLGGEIRTLAQAAPKPLTVNEDTIKKQLKMVATAQK